MKQPANRSLAAVCGVLAAFLCLLPALLLMFGFSLPAQYEETFLGEMKYKMQRLRSTPGKRIIVVGGSSIPFGLNSGLVETHLPDYRVVDFGMYASMGTVVMLDWAKTQAREGDIFILAPEQSHQTLSCFFSGEEVWQAADGAFGLIPLIDSSRYEALVAAFPAFAGKKLHYTLSGAPTLEGVYARASFDAYGDITYPDRDHNILAGGYNPNNLIPFAEDAITADFIRELNDFARAVTAQGAKVFYHFPPMNAAALTPGTGRADVDLYYDFLRGQLLFPILGNPHRSLLESAWFYDSNFHLNAGGATVFTKALIEDLKIYLHDTSPTDIALPPMPAAAPPRSEGDNTHADCFTYRREGDGWILDGLTDAGLGATALTLPGSYRGEAVVGLSETLFAGNTTLQEITLPPNISLLYDGMFRGCTGLQALILTGESPSSYAVGNALREGAGFLIYVPKDALDSYRRNYSWQVYGSYLMPSE